ncbi:hypothetical protein DL767_007873 [Monosporascus sp. MG133]|nr:hypothetical protein DL767_007873 [Monosporascus sp. MG133]
MPIDSMLQRPHIACDLVSSLGTAETKCKSVTAKHVLDYHDIVDAFGHVSVRTPEDSLTFVMAKGMATSPSATSATRLRSRYAAVDIVPLYISGDVQDNLVTQPRFGASLAEALEGNGAFPEHVFVFMKQHGFVACAATIEEAVYQAVYAKKAAGGRNGPGGGAAADALGAEDETGRG